jgi:hypothetical protein
MTGQRYGFLGKVVRIAAVAQPVQGGALTDVEAKPGVSALWTRKNNDFGAKMAGFAP